MTEESIWYWIGFNAFVLVMLFIDLFVFHKKDETPSIKNSLLWTLVCIFLAFVFCGGIYFTPSMGPSKALDFITGYLLEESLSIDNLFVFILLFEMFHIEPQYQHRVLFWGIFGAIVLRATFIFLGAAVLNQFAWVMYIFGIFLIYTGIKMLFEKDEAEGNNPNDNKVLKFLKKFIPVTDKKEGHNFIIKIDGKCFATPLLVALIMIELSDIMFAVDSIPAVLSVTTDTFIVYTSNIFAILGLRSLYFAINGTMNYFRYLKYGLSGILSFIGIKMCYNELIKEGIINFTEIGNIISLCVIIGFVTISILCSILIKEKE